MEADFGRMKMSHMIADTHEELMTMAARIGVRRKWLQSPGTYREHFDICLAKKKLAIQAGAIPVTWKQLGAITLLRRKMLDKIQAARLLSLI